MSRYLSTYFYNTNEPENFVLYTSCCLCGGRLKLFTATCIVGSIYMAIAVAEAVLGVLVFLEGVNLVGQIILTFSILRLWILVYWILSSRTALDCMKSNQVANGLLIIITCFSIIGTWALTQFPKSPYTHYYLILKGVIALDFLFSLVYGYPIVHLLRCHNYPIDHSESEALVGARLENWAHRPHQASSY